MLKRYIAGGLIALTGFMAAPLALAEDLAVIIANEFYDNYPRIRDGRAISALERDFQQAGFEVVLVRNMQSGIDEGAASELWNRMNNADRLVVILSGQFVRTGQTNWLLMTDAKQPSGFTVGASGFPLTSVMEIAAEKQGTAVVAVAFDGSDVDLGPGTSQARFSRSIPQGVTFIAGAQRQVANFIADEVLQPGRILYEAAQGAPRDLLIDGFLPTSQPFLPRSYRRGNPAADTAYWQRVQSTNTLEAYESYLDRYPTGQYASDAKTRIDDLRLTPEQHAQQDEDSLNLSRDQRRAIQRNLTLLGFDTAGVDGIFGRRTRQAVFDWQRSINIPQTGFLSANQISRLTNDGAARAAQLKAEAEAKRAETERQDRGFWRQTGSDGSEAGLRQYLQRFPDGLFADEAKAGLQEYERQNRRQSRVDERDAWDRAVMTGTLQAYQSYLNDFPQGRFAEEAQARVASLSRPETPPQVIEEAKREEDSLRLSGLTRSLIEGQLNNLGLQPGPVDGQFDNNTRRALRRYQRDNGLPVTGFVTRGAIVRLLASAIQ